MSDRAAYHLPGLNADIVREWRYLEKGGVRLRWPMLTSAQLENICAAIAHNREQHLRSASVHDILAAVDAAVKRLYADINQVSRVLSAYTGYSEQVVSDTLRHMFNDWSAPSLSELLRAELGDANLLDHSLPDTHISRKYIAAYGYPFAFHIFSGNVPGVAVTSLIRSLLVKSATLGKTAAGEPLLPVLFAESLTHVAPHIASCLAVTYWQGGTTDLEDAALTAADVVVVYGGEETVRALIAHASQKQIVLHGPRLSFGIVGPNPPPDLPGDVAHAVAAYDQQGCVSPHLVYVVGDPAKAKTFAKAVANELDRIAHSHPRGKLTPDEAVAVRNAQAAAEFAEDGSVLFGGDEAGHSVIFETDPSFKVSCLNRVVYVKPVPSAKAIPALLPPRRFLQSVAIEGFGESETAELSRLLGQSGVSRVTTFERLPWPPMHWHHDGSAPLRELITWQDVEV
ncbi:MAG TPA: acyl-CoA reductase [Longimicrobiales bacterium]